MIDIVSKPKISVKLIHKILIAEDARAVGVVIKTNKITGKISLIAICHSSLKAPAIFDVATRPQLFTEGQLFRLFQAEKVVKIVHDCKDICSQLQQNYNITSNSMFDTQVAYSLSMEINMLPPRLINYADLVTNLTGEYLQVHHLVQQQERKDGNFWDKRPISQQMWLSLSEEVTSLLQTTYPLILKSLPAEILDEFEIRCGWAARGCRKTNDSRPYDYSPRTCGAPVMQLSRPQKEMLQHTRPLTALRS